MAKTIIAICLAVIIIVVVMHGIRWLNEPDTQILTTSREKNIYAELQQQFISQRHTLLERYSDHFQPFEALNVSRPSGFYDGLEKLLPAAAQLLARLPDSLDMKPMLVIVTPERFVSLKSKLDNMMINNSRVTNVLDGYWDNRLLEWTDYRAPNDRPYLLLGVNPAPLNCRFESPWDESFSVSYPCDDFQKCLNLTEVAALLTVHPSSMNPDLAIMAVGSKRELSCNWLVPYQLYFLPQDTTKIWLDVWYPCEELDQTKWWAPQCVARLW